jgi:hypothetical protein
MTRRAKAAYAALLIALYASPAQAASGSGLAYLDGVLAKIADKIVNPLIRAIFALAMIWFFWGVLQFIRGAGDESARSIGKQHMIWGVVGMAIMVSAFAIIQIATGQIGVTPDFKF